MMSRSSLGAWVVGGCVVAAAWGAPFAPAAAQESGGMGPAVTDSSAVIRTAATADSAADPEFRSGIHAGPYMAGVVSGVTGGGLDFAGLGLEVEFWSARRFATWVELGLLRGDGAVVVCPAEVGTSCSTDTGMPWGVVAGYSLFPTGRNARVGPYLGGGAGVGSPGSGLEPLVLIRAGVELRPARRLGVRTELRVTTFGWGAGVGLVF